jgi:hypothetical protein
MTMQGNAVEQRETAPAPKLSDLALRVALWVVYGGAAGEIVYSTKTIEEGMGTPLSSCSSRHAA